MSNMSDFFLTEAPGDEEKDPPDAKPGADETPDGEDKPKKPADKTDGEDKPEGKPDGGDPGEEDDAAAEDDTGDDDGLGVDDGSEGDPGADPGAAELEAEQETNRRVRLYDAIAATRGDLKSLADSATTVSQLANDRRVRKTSEEIADRARQAVEQSDLLLKGFNAIGLEHAKAVYDTFAERAKTCAALLNHLIDGDEGFTSEASAASAKPNAS